MDAPRKVVPIGRGSLCAATFSMTIARFRQRNPRKDSRHDLDPSRQFGTDQKAYCSLLGQLRFGRLPRFDRPFRNKLAVEQDR